MLNEIRLWALIVLGGSLAAGLALVGILGFDQARFVAVSVGLTSAMMLAAVTASILLGCGARRSR